jgi:hypothetical protein
VVLVVAFLPWAATLVGAMVSGVQKVWRDRALAPLTSLLLCWSVFCVLFFTISKSKLPGYVLPAIPVAGLLFARTVEQGLAKRSRILRNLSLSSAVVFALAAGALAFTGRVAALPAAVNGSAAAASAVLFLFSLANLFLWLTELKAGSRGRMEPYRALGMVLPIFVVMLSMNRLIPDFLPGDPSGKTVAREILSNGIPSGRLTIDGMSRGMHFGLNFYLRQEIPDWDNARPLDGYLLLGGSHCETVVRETAWCEDPPIYFKDSQQTLYRVKLKTSLDGLAGGRQPKQEE